MSVIYSENATHRANLLAAETTRQASITPSSTQAQHDTATITYLRACRDSALANKCNAEVFITALRGNHHLNL
jgi:hypothetical protein